MNDSARLGVAILPGIGFTMPSCSAYSTMKGVRMPGVSAGSNQVGASDTWIAQVSWPCGSPAKASRGAKTAAAPTAAPARISRRVIPKPSRIATGVPVAQRVKAIALLLAAPLAEPCTQGRSGMLCCQRYLYVGNQSPSGIGFHRTRRRASEAARNPRVERLLSAHLCLRRTFRRGRLTVPLRTLRRVLGAAAHGRVEMWRGGGRLGISVSAPFVWRCLTGAALAPFPQPAHRTGRAALSGSSAIAGFCPHRSHRAALPQSALQDGPEAG